MQDELDKLNISVCKVQNEIAKEIAAFETDRVAKKAPYIAVSTMSLYLELTQCRVVYMPLLESALPTDTQSESSPHFYRRLIPSTTGSRQRLKSPHSPSIDAG